MLAIYNTLTGEKEPFRPLHANNVRMYVCGITVYDYIHLGHARMLTVFDLVQRYLRASGYNVTYIRNITDIDDKIIQRAADNGEDWTHLVHRFITAMQEDCATLGLQQPDAEPRATHYIGSIIEMIEVLVDKGYAYVAGDGDVLYSVRNFPNYGQLSGRRIDDLRAGARVQIDESKFDPLDFVLWKRAKPGEPFWESPWGVGRPGWHIECSAMSTSLLGNTFDLHGGGMDLKFPHHENEIAQSCAASGEPFVHVWMHNGFVRIDDEKMSKSLGNFFTVREVLKTLRDPEVLRFFLLSSHYRGPINYSQNQLLQADETLLALYRALKDTPPPSDDVTEVEHRDQLTQVWKDFHAAMNDDFNTPQAFAVMQSVARTLNGVKALGSLPETRALAVALRGMGRQLGLLQQDPGVYLRLGLGTAVLDDAAIEARIRERSVARLARNFVESDRLRDVLLSAGVLLDDRPGGRTEWRRA